MAETRGSYLNRVKCILGLFSCDCVFVAKPGEVTITGQSAFLSYTYDYVFVAKPGKVTLTGQVHFRTFTCDCVFVAKPGEVTLTG